MCVKLNQNGRILIPGNIGQINTLAGTRSSSIWGSSEITNARVETLEEKWISKGWKQGYMEVDSFFEGNTEFKTTRPIGVIYKSSAFLVITEPANQQVSRVHHRQPLLLPKH